MVLSDDDTKDSDRENLGSLCFYKFENLDASAVPEEYTILLESLCNHNKSLDLIIACKEWIERGFKLSADKPPATKKCKTKKGTEPAEPKFDKHLLAVDMLYAILSKQSCQKLFLKKHTELWKDMLNFIDDLKRKVELSCEQNIIEEEKIFLRSLLYVLLKLSVLLHADTEYNSVEFVEDTVFWVQNKLLKSTCMEISQKTSSKRSRLKNKQKSTSFEEFTFEICKVVCTFIADMALGKCLDLNYVFLNFSMDLLTLGFGGKLLLSVSNLLFNHITHEVYKIIEGRDSSLLKCVPAIFSKIIKCLNDEEFFNAIPLADSHRTRCLLAGCLLCMYHPNFPSMLNGLVFCVITEMTQTILNHIIGSVENWDDFEKKCDPFELISISWACSYILHVMCVAPRIMVLYLKQLQQYLLSSRRDISVWVACYVIVAKISEIRMIDNQMKTTSVVDIAKTISPEKLIKITNKKICILVLEMENILLELYPMKDIDTKLLQPENTSESSNEEEENLNFGEHCHNEYKKLKALLHKAKII